MPRNNLSKSVFVATLIIVGAVPLSFFSASFVCMLLDPSKEVGDGLMGIWFVAFFGMMIIGLLTAAAVSVRVYDKQ